MVIAREEIADEIKESPLRYLLFSSKFNEFIAPLLVEELKRETVKIPYVEGHVALFPMPDWVKQGDGDRDPEREKSVSELVGSLPLLFVQFHDEHKKVFEDLDVEWREINAFDLVDALSAVEHPDKRVHVISTISGEGSIALHGELIKRIQCLVDTQADTTPFMYEDRTAADFKPHTLDDDDIFVINGVLSQIDWVVAARAFDTKFNDGEGTVLMIDVASEMPRAIAQAYLKVPGATLFSELDLENFACVFPHDEVPLSGKTIPCAKVDRPEV